jgi:hypothetical protein
MIAFFMNNSLSVSLCLFPDKAIRSFAGGMPVSIAKDGRCPIDERPSRAPKERRTFHGTGITKDKCGGVKGAERA